MIDGAQARRSDHHHEKAGHVDGKVWIEVLMSECGAQALARVLVRAEAFDENEADAVLNLRKAPYHADSRDLVSNSHLLTYAARRL